MILTPRSILDSDSVLAMQPSVLHGKRRARRRMDGNRLESIWSGNDPQVGTKDGVGRTTPTLVHLLTPTESGAISAN